MQTDAAPAPANLAMESRFRLCTARLRREFPAITRNAHPDSSIRYVLYRTSGFSLVL